MRNPYQVIGTRSFQPAQTAQFSTGVDNTRLTCEVAFVDPWATYHFDNWDSHPAEGYAVSPDVTL